MFVYADNAATTKMSKTAIDAMLPYLDTWYGNASSLYAFGQKSAEALAAARETVAGVWAPRRGDHLHLRRQRGGQPGHSLRGGHRREEGQKSTSFPRRLSITRCCIRSRS